MLVVDPGRNQPGLRLFGPKASSHDRGDRGRDGVCRTVRDNRVPGGLTAAQAQALAAACTTRANAVAAAATAFDSSTAAARATYRAAVAPARQTYRAAVRAAQTAFRTSVDQILGRS